MEWIVSIDAELTSEFSDELADHVIEELSEYSPAVGGRDHRVGVTISVQAATDRQAFDHAHAALRHALSSRAKIVDVRVQTVEGVERELEAPALPALAGISEVASILGVSRQRASQLANSAVFPEPICALAAGPVWLRTAVVTFGERERQPGRTRTSSQGDRQQLT